MERRYICTMYEYNLRLLRYGLVIWGKDLKEFPLKNWFFLHVRIKKSFPCLWKRMKNTSYEGKILPTCGKEVSKYLCFLPVGKKQGNIPFSHQWERSGEIFIFTTCRKEFRKYLCFISVQKKSGNIYVSYLRERSREIFLFPTCGKKSGNISFSYLWGRSV